MVTEPTVVHHATETIKHGDGETVHHDTAVHETAFGTDVHETTATEPSKKNETPEDYAYVGYHGHGVAPAYTVPVVGHYDNGIPANGGTTGFLQ